MASSNRPDHEARALWYGRAMEQLIEVVQQLSLARDLQAVMEIVRHAARRLTGADGATFILRDGDLCFYAEEDAISPLWKGQRFPMEHCISGWAMLNRQSAVIEDIYADPRVPADAYRPTFVRSMAMVPIRTLDPIGAIGNYWARQYQPTPEQVKVLQALADTTAVAIENVRVYEGLEQRVRERTSELETILDNVQVGVVFVDNGTVARANPKSAEMFDFDSPADMVGRPMQALLQGPERDASIVEAAAAALAQGRMFDTEAQILRPNQSNFWAHLACKPLGSDAYPGGAIWMLDDISVSKEKERLLVQMKLAAERSAQFKSEFLAGMSHELRTPLNAIIGFSEILRDGLVGELGEKQREYIGDIFNSGQHLLALVNDILDLSKVEAGMMALEGEMADIGQLLANSLAIVKEKAQTNALRLEFAMPERLGKCWLDQRKLKQIVYNLLSNAVKFTPKGGQVTLHADIVDCADAQQPASDMPEIRTPLSEKSDRFLRLTVSDTGIGIAAEDMPRLFQPFVQLETSHARQFEGTGLGLSLVRKLTELHDGSVGVASLPGQGSRFTVWLPYHDAPVQTGAETAVRSSDLMVKAGTSATVLLVEDDDKAADLIRLQLEAGHYRVMRAATAEAALAMLETGPLPDLISLDIMLPGMDGWDFLAKIKQHPKLAHIPVVILSVVSDCSKGFALGAADVLQKPVSVGELMSALARMGFAQNSAADKPLTVLAIDDDANALEIVSSHLQQAHFDVICASGGAEGIRLAQTSAPELIILDLMMPDVNGFEVAEALKRNRQTAHIPMLVLTSKLLTQDDRKRLSRHMMQVVDKSEFDPSGFLDEIHRAIGKEASPRVMPLTAA